MKLCYMCKSNEATKSGKCIKCQRKANQEWYQKNKDQHKSRILNNLKSTNYKNEKTPVQRVIRRIKERTRRNFPITQDSRCEICGEKATERHHNTDPIQYDKFIFVCHNCHIDADKIKRGLTR